jgi:hypothetical protein
MGVEEKERLAKTANGIETPALDNSVDYFIQYGPHPYPRRGDEELL